MKTFYDFLQCLFIIGGFGAIVYCAFTDSDPVVPLIGGVLIGCGLFLFPNNNSQ